MWYNKLFCLLATRPAGKFSDQMKKVLDKLVSLGYNELTKNEVGD